MAALNGFHTSGARLVQDYSADIQGKIILVTGASGGIGALFAKAIATAKPAMLILAGRTHATLESTREEIIKAFPEINVKVLDIDLSSLESVRSAATTLKSWDDVTHVDLLVNNAAIMASPYSETRDGFERQFATNYLGPFLFTNLIIDSIMASKTPRVVNVSSDGHRFSPIRWYDYNFKGGENYEKWRAYGQSKTAVCLMTMGMAKRLGAKGLTTLSLHPGVFVESSALGRDLDWVTGDAFTSLNAVDIAMGNSWIEGNFQYKNADEIISTLVYASFDKVVENHNGAYLMDCHVADQYKDEVWPWANNAIESERLWRLTEKLLDQKFEY